MKPLRTDRLIHLRIVSPLVLATATLMLAGIVSFHYRAARHTCIGGRATWHNSVNHSPNLLRERAYGWRVEENCDRLNALFSGFFRQPHGSTRVGQAGSALLPVSSASKCASQRHGMRYLNASETH